MSVPFRRSWTVPVDNQIIANANAWHIVYQLEDGTWAGKHGTTGNSKHFEDVVDPSNLPEKHAMWKTGSLRHTGTTCYLAITK